MNSQSGRCYDAQLPQRSPTLASPSELRRSPSSTSINGDAYLDSRDSMPSHSDDTHTRSNHNQYSSHQDLQQQPQQPQQPQSPVALSVCAECSNNVTGQFVRALGVVFHKDCFRCKVCPYRLFCHSWGSPAPWKCCETLAAKYPPNSRYHNYISNVEGTNQPPIGHALVYLASPVLSMHMNSHKIPG